MSPLSHLKYMLLGGAGLAVVALLFGVPLQTALFLGILLACPLMMIFMMRGHGEGHDLAQDGGKGSEPQRPDEPSAHPHRL